MKKIMTTDQLIDHMKQKGITFERTNEKSAKRFLRTTNYYYKLASYRKNFQKDTDGKYKNLDFSQLTDLAAIDVKLREYLLELCLDIEHGIKVILLDITSNSLDYEDGYKIVREFRDSSKFGYEQYTITIKNLKNNQYLKEMSNKYSDNPPIWVFLEVISFGGLTAFTEYFQLNRKSTKKLRRIASLLRYCKNVRNAAAHNTPLLVNLFANSDHIENKPAQITGIANDMNLENKDLYYEKMVDFTAVFYLHKILQSKRSGDFQYNNGQKLIKRINRHKEWYKETYELNKFINNLSKMIEYLKN